MSSHTDGLGCLECGQWVCECESDDDYWKQRAEKAEAELGSIRKGAGKEIERWNILNNENQELKAEVERLQGKVEDLKRVMEEALDIIGDNMDIVQSQEAYVVHEHALDNAMDLLLDGVVQQKEKQALDHVEMHVKEWKVTEEEQR